MNLFKQKQQEKSTVAKLIERSSQQMNIFRVTADSLKDLNVEIESEQDRIQEEIKAKQIQFDSLQITKNDNARTESKIRAFLED